ncbi:MAG: TylF/MycF/NovP-related O-methyltransferase [Bacteroidota bacterium]
MEQTQLLYLELLKKTLIDLHRSDMTEYRPAKGKKIKVLIDPLLALFKLNDKRELVVCEKVNFTLEKRMYGKDWPLYADSMIGYKRMSNVQNCVIDVINSNIPGDLIETGVWRGGTVIFMRAILKAFNVTDRIVWAADSFDGLPEPNPNKYQADKEDRHYTFDELKISLDIVKKNFQKYDLLDGQVKFLKGWFSDTLPTAPINKLAVLRLDGDMYESTMDGLENLYPKLSVGGYLIIDDWGSVKGCQLAVNDYRKKYGIIENIITVDDDAVYWKKTK